MKGMQNLIDRRLDGDVPELLHIDIGGPYWPETGHLVVEPVDRLSTLDLRAVQGLSIAVSGDSAGRARAVAAACVEAGAGRVIATVGHFVKADRYEVTEVTDTEGVLTWKC